MSELGYTGVSIYIHKEHVLIFIFSKINWAFNTHLLKIWAVVQLKVSDEVHKSRYFQNIYFSCDTKEMAVIQLKTFIFKIAINFQNCHLFSKLSFPRLDK